MENFENKIALITGASSGIGKATAELFAATGSCLILCGRNFDKILELAEELYDSYSVDVFPLQLDVTDCNQVQSSIAALPSHYQNVDILINNAGLAAGLDPIQEGQIEDWEAMIDTNVKGLLYVTRSILPQMLARKSGHIINIGSISGHQVYPKGAVYCATKHAVRALSEGLRMDVFGTPIRVSSIDPGMVETDFSRVRFKNDLQRAKAVYEGMQPLTPDDIADAILYCATRPPHVNISEMIIMPTDQVSVSMVSRKK